MEKIDGEKVFLTMAVLFDEDSLSDEEIGLMCRIGYVVAAAFAGENIDMTTRVAELAAAIAAFAGIKAKVKTINALGNYIKTGEEKYGND